MDEAEVSKMNAFSVVVMIGVLISTYIIWRLVTWLVSKSKRIMPIILRNAGIGLLGTLICAMMVDLSNLVGGPRFIVWQQFALSMFIWFLAFTVLQIAKGR